MLVVWGRWESLGEKLAGIGGCSGVFLWAVVEIWARMVILMRTEFAMVLVGIFGLSAFGAALEPSDNPATGGGEPRHGSNGMTTGEYSSLGHRIERLSEERIAELAEKLNEEESRVILNDGTEPAFCGNLVDNKEEGVYLCRLCDLPLFASGSKFTSGTGWPSFFQPVDDAHIDQVEDTSHGMQRVEIECARCGGHLGHVFPDGPEPTGLRFCVLGVGCLC